MGSKLPLLFVWLTKTQPSRAPLSQVTLSEMKDKLAGR